MGPAVITEKVRTRFPDVSVIEGSLDLTIQADAAIVLDLLAFLRDDPALSFDFLMCVTAMDLLGLKDPPVLRVVYHLFSYRHRHTIVVRVDVPRDAPVVPSVAALFPTAIWQEREAFDLVGVRFDGHPDLRRILLPDEWDGHPLRKDWKEAETALGYSTRREGLLDLIRRSSGGGAGE